MRTDEINVMRVKESYSRNKDMRQLINYIARDKKDGGNVRYYSGRGVRKNPENAAKAMNRTQKNYKKNSGRRMYHWIISFPEIYDDANLVKIAADMVAELFYKKGYQVYYGVHEDTDNLHIHMAVNAVNYMNGLKLHFSMKELKKLECKIKNEIICVFL